MRVTDAMLTQSYLTGLNASKIRKHKIQEQISTGSKVNRPSDNPSGANRILQLNEQISSSDSFLKNITNSKSFVNSTISSLQHINQNITSISTLIVQSKNSLSGNPSLTADQIEMLFESIVTAANGEYDGKFLFGGTDFSDKPYTYDKATQTVTTNVSIDGEHIINVAKNNKIKINLTGEEVFGERFPEAGNKNIFEAITSVITSFRNGTPLNDDDVKAIELFGAHSLNKLSVAGDLVNRLTFTEELLDNQIFEMMELRSKEQDVDIAEAIMNLQNEDYLMNLSHKMASMILPKTLLDYL